MRNLETIAVEKRTRKRRLTGPGWVRVYAILAAMAAVLFYIVTRKP